MLHGHSIIVNLPVDLPSVLQDSFRIVHPSVLLLQGVVAPFAAKQPALLAKVQR